MWEETPIFRICWRENGLLLRRYQKPGQSLLSLNFVSLILTQNIHVGPSDFVPWLTDNKVAFIRIESRHFGDVPTHVEVRLSVEDSPNSAGVVIDAIRCCKLALDRHIAGPLEEPSSFFMKSPPKQFTDEQAQKNLEKFIDSH